MPRSPEPASRDHFTVIVAVVDRGVRRAWSQALSDAGYAVRSVSRAAELAKALSDGEARLVIRRDHVDDAALVTQAAADAEASVLSLDASTASDTLHGYIHEALAQMGER